MMRLRNIVLAAIITLVVADVHAQGTKNILRIWFDTLTVQTVPTQVVMNVFYKLEGTKPHNFRGFECRIAYEGYQISPTLVFWDGTACGQASYHKYNIIPLDQQLRIQVLTAGDIELDLTKPVLFRIAWNVKKTLNDTVYGDMKGLMECFHFDDSLSSDNGIDEVIIENDRYGWIRYEPPVVPEPDTVVKKNIFVSTDPGETKADTIVEVPVQVSSLDSANIQHGIFGFALDTSVLTFIDVQPGPVLGAGGVATVRDNSLEKVSVYFSGADSTKALTGSGELLKLRFKAVKREDTVCTELRDTGFFALNDSVLTDTVFYSLGQICVFGEKEQHGVVEREETPVFQAVPNPARDEIKFYTDEDRSCDLVIWNVLGESVLRTAITGDRTIDIRRWAPGTYRAMLMRNGRIAASEQFIIIR